MRILITSRTIIVASPLGLASLADVRSVTFLQEASMEISDQELELLKKYQALVVHAENNVI
ncbi:MAG: hypothetical protein CMH98_15140 [Oceanospirillaceae bacterium]|nr:hypothetical protein [Oceanospirillaceae bacterium]|tara:strand:- start:15 stop:197 length:183 start_codon:yes stop_codon:yes gene_type:complete